MRASRLVLASALALVGLPAVLVPIEAASFYAANRDTGSFVHEGVRREYLLYVPKRYDGRRPTPLVISLHGAGLWGAVQRDFSRWNDEADREGFIVVYPSAVGGRGIRVWHAGPEPGPSRDVRFLGALIDTIEAHYTIDPARVYANGLSNGGGMSFVLSCTMADRIAAVGLVGSAQLLPWRWCTERRPVPMVDFHGTDDRMAPYGGGKTWIADERFPSQRGWAANWARRNGCALRPVDSVVAPDVTRRTYSHCANGADVVLYTILGGGHAWPGGNPVPEWFAGRTTPSISATGVMWTFFKQHPLVQPRR